ncbi:MAG: 3-keto-5-aminohexanoate cleavage protein [Spirochaetales bacterium]|nr:3-keto-5-aminohexanoate cleavage protein [Spirochaetales bacterium]
METHRKILLSVAPTAHENSTHFRNPVTPEEIAEDVVNCAEEGASMVHLHVRDAEGKLTSDPECYNRTVSLIRKKSDILIQGSTGGVSTLSLQDRCTAVYQPETVMASLNMGSTNFKDTVYINTVPDVRFWAQEMQTHKVIPELEIFSFGMIETAKQLQEENILKEPMHFNFSFGFPGAIPAEPEILAMLKTRLPYGKTFGIIHNDMENMSLLAAAVSMGASAIRVGFEDSPWIHKRLCAKSNTELVKEAASLVKSLGYELMNTGEAETFIKKGFLP